MAAVITEQARNGQGSELSTGKPVAIQAHLRAALPVLAAALVLGIFYLGIYVVRHYSLPIGWDTPRYLFHANFAAARGLGGIPGSLPPPSKTLQARPGFAIVVLPLSNGRGRPRRRRHRAGPRCGSVPVVHASPRSPWPGGRGVGRRLLLGRDPTDGPGDVHRQPVRGGSVPGLVRHDRGRPARRARHGGGHRVVGRGRDRAPADVRSDPGVACGGRGALPAGVAVHVAQAGKPAAVHPGRSPRGDHGGSSRHHRGHDLRAAPSHPRHPQAHPFRGQEEAP